MLAGSRRLQPGLFFTISGDYPTSLERSRVNIHAKPVPRGTGMYGLGKILQELDFGKTSEVSLDDYQSLSENAAVVRTSYMLKHFKGGFNAYHLLEGKTAYSVVKLDQGKLRVYPIDGLDVEEMYSSAGKIKKHFEKKFKIKISPEAVYPFNFMMPNYNKEIEQADGKVTLRIKGEMICYGNNPEFEQPTELGKHVFRDKIFTFKLEELK